MRKIYIGNLNLLFRFNFNSFAEIINIKLQQIVDKAVNLVWSIAIKDNINGEKRVNFIYKGSLENLKTKQKIKI